MASRLERILKSGRFAVTCEFDSPDSADPQLVLDRARVLDGICDAINVTDASGAHPHISSLAACTLLASAGREVVLQMSCRDRNRIAMQGDLLGAAALGIRNVLCITGDGVQNGDHPEAKPVFDLDSLTLLEMARTLRDKGTFLSGRRISSPPEFFLGAVENPFAPPFDFRPLRLAKKIAAGAQFIQTQFCFELSRLRNFLNVARQQALLEQVALLVGVGPIRSAKSAEWMRSRVPGVYIPDGIVSRIQGVLPKDQEREGKRICIEIIRQIQELPGVRGIHLMAYKHEEVLGEILEEARLLPRPAGELFETSRQPESDTCLP